MAKTGIDVSSVNGVIPFDALKSQIDFAIIRCGYGNDSISQDDSQYERNVRECERLGIPYGVYFYSYALDLDEADSEARHCLRLLKKASPTYGVWFDMEDGDGYKARNGFPSKDMLVRICERFLKTVEDAGYYVGLYASLSWLNGYLDDRRLDRFDKWVAQWAQAPTYKGAFGIWQYTSTLRLSGYSGNLDGDKAFYDYPALTVKNPSQPEEKPEPDPSDTEVTVSGSGVNFREDAYVGAPVIAVLGRDSRLTWLWDDGWGWSKCRYNGKEGFITNEYLSGKTGLSTYKKARVFGNDVNVRNMPSLSGRVIDSLWWGNELTVISIDPNNWIRAEVNGVYGYVKYDSTYIKILN